MFAVFNTSPIKLKHGNAQVFSHIPILKTYKHRPKMRSHLIASKLYRDLILLSKTIIGQNMQIKNKEFIKDISVQRNELIRSCYVNSVIKFVEITKISF